MTRATLSLFVFVLLGVFSLPATAAASGGGGGGGGSGGGAFWCKVMCYITHGSCTIPSGDPDVPPLKDPFCEQRRSDCLAGCSGDGGGGGGGLVIGWNSPAAAGPMQMSPLLTSACDARDGQPG